VTQAHTGQCLCGQVHYTVAGDPLMVGICHCRNCQRQSGAPFSVVWAVADDAFAQAGTTREFIDRGDSGAPVRRLFCPECGSPIRSRADAMPGVCFVKAGTLDDPGARAATFEVYCDRAWTWLPPLAEQRHALALGE
jgi:hypothetical protein